MILLTKKDEIVDKIVFLRAIFLQFKKIVKYFTCIWLSIYYKILYWDLRCIFQTYYCRIFTRKAL